MEDDDSEEASSALPYQDKFFAIEKRLIQGCRSFYADHFSYMV
jgi:hypothetical protein